MKYYAVILALLFIPAGLAFNPAEYEYMSLVTVLCSEYKGYAQFALPPEYNPGMQAYMHGGVSIAQESSYYSQHNNWYVKELDQTPLTEVEKLTDGNYNTALAVQGTNALTLPFENPQSYTIGKVAIDVKDSALIGVSVTVNGNTIPGRLTQDTFHYEYTLNTPVQADRITITLTFDSVVQIREVTFHNQVTSASKNYGYLYVDNNCNDQFTLYFGRYGESNYRSGPQHPPVYFQTLVTTRQNSEYNPDFDADTVLNPSDNCISVANTDQKDINYNGKGDACEDDDNDRVSNAIDNCPIDYNYGQADADNDGLGDECDPSDDRFFEKNAVLVYILAGLIVAGFAFLAIKIMKKS